VTGTKLGGVSGNEKATGEDQSGGPYPLHICLGTVGGRNLIKLNSERCMWEGYDGRITRKEGFQGKTKGKPVLGGINDGCLETFGICRGAKKQNRPVDRLLPKLGPNPI